MNDKMEIPEKYQEFCREVAKLAIKYQVEKAYVRLQPAYDDGWKGEITAHWEMGRHGDTAHRIYITSEIRVHTDLSGDPKGFYG